MCVMQGMRGLRVPMRASGKAVIEGWVWHARTEVHHSDAARVKEVQHLKHHVTHRTPLLLPGNSGPGSSCPGTAGQGPAQGRYLGVQYGAHVTEKAVQEGPCPHQAGGLRVTGHL